MTAMNRVFLAGNLTRDPVLRQTTGGQAVADLGIAVTDTFTNRNGEKVETTCFADIVAWGRLAETCNQYLGKGSPILLEGRLELDAWQTAEGEKRNKLRVRADRVQFLGRPRNGSGNGQAGAKAGRKPAPAGRAGDDEKVDF